MELITYFVDTNYIFPAPSLADYKRYKSKKELEELEELEVNNDRTFKGSSCFIPAPLLCFFLINAGTNNPLELIPMVILAGEEFDRENFYVRQGLRKGHRSCRTFRCLDMGYLKEKSEENQVPHSNRRCQNFKILGSTPRRLHHGIYMSTG